MAADNLMRKESARLMAGQSVRPFLVFLLMVNTFAFAHADDLRYYGLFNYSYPDLLVPGKWGGSIGMWQDDNHQLELEYLQGSISNPWIMEDVGSVTDRRISLIRRNYYGGSFNFAYGLVYFDLTAFIGSELLESFDEDAPSADIIEAKSLGSYLSIGNRWQFSKRGVIGVDWFAWSQPWIRLREESEFFDEVTNEDDENLVYDALQVVYRFPRLTLFKVQVGLKF